MEIVNAILTVLLTSSVIGSLVSAWSNHSTSKRNQETMKELEKLKRKYDLLFKKIEIFSSAKSELQNLLSNINSQNAEHLLTLKDYNSRFQIWMKIQEDFNNQRKIYNNIQPYLDIDLTKDIEDKFIKKYDDNSSEFFNDALININDVKWTEEDIQKKIELYFGNNTPTTALFKKALSLTIDNQLLRLKNKLLETNEC